MDYAKKYSQLEVPSIWYIDKVVRDAMLQTKKPKKKKRKNSAEYLLFPVQCINNLGSIQQSADFIGKKYIAGRSEPINVFSTSYYRPFKLHQIKRILAEKTTYAIETLEKQWSEYPIPDVHRIDNGLQFRGSGSGKRAVGMFLRFLLNLNVIPLFGSPSKPWTNPHVEGHNRVFNEKVWGQNFFSSLKQIDQECNNFNQDGLDLFHYKYDQLIFNGNFRYLEKRQKIKTDKLETVKDKKVYFIRFVESFNTANNAYIEILNEKILLLEKFNHQFVFVEWNIEKEQLNIYSEFRKNITLIKQIKFRLNV